MSKLSMSATSGFPSVIVPVLSNTHTSTSLELSNVSPFLISMPYSAALPTPTVTAVGVARPNEHGHATTSTDMRHVSANSKPEPATKYHNRNTMIAIVKITGMNHVTILFASLCTGGLDPCAFSTS